MIRSTGELRVGVFEVGFRPFFFLDRRLQVVETPASGVIWGKKCPFWGIWEGRGGKCDKTHPLPPSFGGTRGIPGIVVPLTPQNLP